MINGIDDCILDILVTKYGYKTSSRTKDVNYDALQKDIDKMTWDKEYPFPWTEKLRHSP